MLRFRSIFPTFVIAILVQCANAGTVHYVDDSAPPAGDGTTWNTAFRYLQDALAVASDGDEIRVGQGTYRPDQSEYDNAVAGNRNERFLTRMNMSISGAYAGFGEVNPDARDFEKYETILSGDLLGDDGPDFENTADNSYGIIWAVDDNEVTLDGLILRGGTHVIGDVGGSGGGGLLARNTSVTLRHCKFENNFTPIAGAVSVYNALFFDVFDCEFTHNRASQDKRPHQSIGGAVFANGEYITITRCLIDNNYSSGSAAGLSIYGAFKVSVSDSFFTRNRGNESGGGALIQGDTVVISNSHFIDNGLDNPSHDGAGLFCDAEHLDIRNCRFEDNVAGAGAGAQLQGTVRAFIDRCEFNDNTASLGAGGAFVSSDQLIMTNCWFRSNEGGYAGGGLAGGGDKGSIIANCYFVDNRASLFGGGFAAGGFPIVTNCIFTRNSAITAGGMLLSHSIVINCTFDQNTGGAVSADGQNALIQNSILWNNPPQEVVQFQSSKYIPTIQYSNVKGGYPGAGNVDADPLFVQPGAYNFRLGNGSPCLNAGNNSYLPADAGDLDDDGDTTEPLPIDLAGTPRIANGTVDIGAYEGGFDVLPLAAINDDFDPGESVVLVPGGGEFGDEQTLAVRAFNQGTQHNATILVTDLRGTTPIGPGPQPMLRVETDLPPGELRIRAKLPFTIESINGGDPLEPNLVRHDENAGGWSLATAKNVFINPAYNEPIGDRFIVEGSDTTLPSLVVGDYGVFWNPSTQRGFVWASVDKGGEFSRRNTSCPGDGAPYGGNGVVNIYDLLDMLRAWGHDNRWFDTNSDDIVDSFDLMTLFEAWGTCD